MSIMICGVDTGHFTQYAYQFIDEFEGCAIVGLKGKDIDKMRRFGVDTPIFKVGKAHKKLYLVEVNQVKDELSELMALDWDEANGVDQPAGLMNFPIPEKGKYNMKDYFSHFEAEHKIMEKNAAGENIGSRWVKKKSTLQNHLFDCRVYNLTLKQIWINILLTSMGYKIKDISWSAYVELVAGDE